MSDQILFFTNRGGFYFSADESVDVDLLKASGCHFYENPRDLYRVIADRDGIEPEDVAATTFAVSKGVVYDDRGFGHQPTEGVNAYLIDFEM